MERKYHSPKDYQDAAKSSRTSVEELSFLAGSEYDFVRLAVVRNVNVTPSALRAALPDRFDTWNSQQIASEIASNPKTPHNTFKQIIERLTPFLNNGRGNEMAAEAAVNLCTNPAVPLIFIGLLLESKNVAIGIRKKIASNTNRRDVLEFMLSDQSGAVRRRAMNSLKKSA